MHIIIVGGGIAGLATYLALRKHLPSTLDHQITIFESHPPRSRTSHAQRPTSHSPSTSSSRTAVAYSTVSYDGVDVSQLYETDLSIPTALIGGGLGIPPNGMRVLRSLSLELHDAVVAQGFPVEKFVFNGANGWELSTQGSSVRYPNESSGGYESESDPSEGVQEEREEGFFEECTLASSRHGLWTTLLHFVGEHKIAYRKVTAVERLAEGRVLVWSARCDIDADGSEEADVEVEIADLVIGADGIKSMVRDFMFDAGEQGKCEWFKPHYTGLTGVGGFLDRPIPTAVISDKAIVFTLTRRGIIGYTSSGPTSHPSPLFSPKPQTLMWWTTFATPAALSPYSPSFDAPSLLLATIQKRYAHVRDPVIRSILHSHPTHPITFTYTSYTIPELPFWGSHSAVLIGDAAHALDQTTGQGAAQALEDAETLALLLSGCMLRSADGRFTEQEALAIAMRLLYEIRNPRVRRIALDSRTMERRKKNAGTLRIYARYWLMWATAKWAWLGKFIYGEGDPTLYTWSAEKEVRKALQKMDDDRFEELRLLSRPIWESPK